MKHIYLLVIFPVFVVTTIAQTGNTGIGTATPGSKLTVNGSFAAAYIPITSTAYAAGENDFYVVWNGTSAGTVTLPASDSGPDRTGRLYFFKNTSASFILTIDAAGTELIDNSSTLMLQPGESAMLIKTNDNTTSGITYNVIQIAKTESIYTYAVSSGTAETHAQGAQVTANFTQIDYSTNGGGDFDLSANTWTCPQTGYYRIEAFEIGQIPTTTNVAAHRAIIISKNGGGVASQFFTMVNISTASMTNGGNATTILHLVQGDQITVRLQMCSGCGAAQMTSVRRRMIITRM